MATSATLADPERGTDAAKEFAARFFGIQANNVEVVLEQYVEDDWAAKRRVPRSLPGDPREHLKNLLEAVESGDDGGALVRIALRAMTGEALDEDAWQEDLYNRLAANEMVYQIAQALRHPKSQERPRLWLSVEDVQEAAQKNQREQYHPLPVTACNTCWQHYFTLHVKDFEFTGQRPGGGDAMGEGQDYSCFLSGREG